MNHWAQRIGINGCSERTNIVNDNLYIAFVLDLTPVIDVFLLLSETISLGHSNG